MMPNPADGYNERHIRKMKWRRIVTILSCIVVFCTTYALIIPAVTMSRDTACGKEEHTHTEACYDENGALICGREEHTHTDACLLAVRELTYEDGQLKNSQPTVDKQVQENSNGTWGDTNDANIGDTVNFKTTINVVDGQPKNYVLHDKMSNGLTFDAGSVEVKIGDRTLTLGSDYTLIANPKDGCTFEIEFKENVLKPNDVVIVTYSATLNEKAVIYPEPNTNETKLVYGEGSETTWDETKTFTYQFDLVKTKTDNTVLNGAEFKLYDAKTEGNEIALIDEGNGVYRVATAAEKAAEGFVSATIKAGKVTIKGLDSGTYYLEETKAPAGYNVLAERVEVKIDHANLTATVEGDTYVSGGVQVINKTGAELPSTGGIGTTIFYVVGGLLVVAAGVLLVTRKRMSKSED